jgi:hypothetical protein
MKIKGPFLTLAAGVVLAAGLIELSSIAAHSDTAPAPRALATSAKPAAPPAGSEASPSPTASPNVELKTAPEVTYAGPVGGTGAQLAIVTKDGQAVAYLCDGKKTEAWLRGTAAGGQLDLTGKQASLTGKYDANKPRTATGSVTLAGKSWSFTIKQTTAPSGLYRAAATVRNAKVVGGWIVLPNGRQVGIVSVNDVPTASPVLDLTTGTATLDGTQLTAQREVP